MSADALLIVERDMFKIVLLLVERFVDFVDALLVRSRFSKLKNSFRLNRELDNQQIDQE